MIESAEAKKAEQRAASHREVFHLPQHLRDQRRIVYLKGEGRDPRTDHSEVGIVPHVLCELYGLAQGGKVIVHDAPVSDMHRR